MDCVYYGAGYSVEIDGSYFKILVNNEEFFSFRIGCGASTMEQYDIDEAGYHLELQNTEPMIVKWVGRSNLWEKKEYILTCAKNYFLFTPMIYGTGKLGKLDYFSGAVSPGKRGSKYEVSNYFFPMALGDGRDSRYFTTAIKNEINLNYMAPPAFCYPFEMEENESWLGIGLVAKEGKYNFDHFQYNLENAENGYPNCFFSTNFYGHTVVEGMFECPSILGIVGGNEYTVLENYSKWHFDTGWCRKNQRPKEKFWYGPLFCGWGEQCDRAPNNPFSLATQAEYEQMDNLLEKRGLHPSAIIIDDKWQTSYGEALPNKEKWPDLRGFVDSQHEKGRKVLLWFKSWDTEGLTNDECVTLWSISRGADPTSPLYQKRMKDTIYRLLSPDEGCYNCDGFKIDFMNCMPLGKDISIHAKGIYGVELLKRLLQMLYTYAKEAKPEALINNSCCHPYFAEVTDQVRLHDYYAGCRNAVFNLTTRAKMFHAALPDALIDTDGAGNVSRRDAMNYNRAGARLGVPDLYRLSTNLLTEADWQEIKELWENYQRTLN